MKSKINQSVLNRIKLLEEKYPKLTFNIQEYVNELINTLESILGYQIRQRIQNLDYKYTDRDTLDKEILKFLTIEELRIIIKK